MDKKAGKKEKQNSENLRKTGIDFIGDAPWGTHFFQFYKTKKDLTDILVPYFKAGLENNEFCMWVTSEPLKVEDAKKSLRKAVKNLDEYTEKGQMEILDYSQWYTKTGKFDADRVLKGWVGKEQEAFKRGFDGLRLTGNTFWLKKEDWKDFFDYEARVDSIIGQHRMTALCTYSLDKCGINEVLDVTANHDFALIKREGKWGMIQGFKAIQFKKELIDSALKWRSTFDAIKDAVSLIDVEGKIVRSNRAMSDLLGKPFHEIIGRTCCELVHGTSEPIPGCPVVRIKETRQRETLELPIGDKWFEVTADPILDESGGLIGAVHTISDIIERKRMEEDLHRSRAAYKDLVENLNNIIYTISSDGLITYVSPVVKEHLGFSPTELIGRPFKEVIHPEDLDRILKAFHDVLENRLYPSEYRQLKKNGEICWVSASSRPVYEDGAIIGIQGVLTDITERKRAEEMLQKSELKYRQLIEQAPDTIFVVDVEGNLLHVNLTGQKMLGYSKDELCKMTTLDTYPLDEMAVARRRLMEMRTMRAGETMHFERQMRRKNGTLFPVEISVGALKDGTTHAIIRDITERKRAEEQLQGLLRRLVEIQEADYRLLAGDLHDQVGQNLTALSINLSFIRSQFPEAYKFNKRIVERLEDSLELVENAIEHIRNLMVGLRPPVLDDYGLVSALRWHSERFSERTGVHIVLQAEELSPRLPVIVETALFRIFQEVLTNVAKHARARQVNVALKEINGMAQLTITDNGVGFDSSDMQELKKEPGWGLITIEERAKAFGGHLSVISAANQGTQVVVKVQR